jgi:hypothetical protein
MRGATRGRAQDEIRCQALVAQEAAHAAGRVEAARCQIPVTVAQVRLVPARLGVAEQKQLGHLDAALPEWAKGCAGSRPRTVTTRLP